MGDIEATLVPQAQAPSVIVGLAAKTPSRSCVISVVSVKYLELSVPRLGRPGRAGKFPHLSVRSVCALRAPSLAVSGRFVCAIAFSLSLQI